MQFSSKITDAAAKAENKCASAFSYIDDICEYNSRKVLDAFIKNRVSSSHFAGTTGYGYDDAGRDNLDRIFADIFGTEDALVRHNFISGTHALSTALFGVLRPNDTLLAVTGKPYDTLDEVIGIGGKTGDGSLNDFGVNYAEIPLKDGKIDINAVTDAVKTDNSIKIVYIQRSGGYSARSALTSNEIGTVAKTVKEIKPQVIVMVDNCYGEFTEKQEPTELGADIAIGSLIKNAGGGQCNTGGYIVGSAKLIELCSYRLTSVGMGKEVGCTLNELKNMYEGLFLAPSVTANAVKSAVFASALFEELGMAVSPSSSTPRSDIITNIAFGDRDKLIAFVQGIQMGSPVDSFAIPEPWAMPGYSDEVIMAAGAFTQGASIELSCDAPIRPPYVAYLQGGITYHTAKAGIMLAADRIFKE